MKGLHFLESMLSDVMCLVFRHATNVNKLSGEKVGQDGTKLWCGNLSGTRGPTDTSRETLIHQEVIQILGGHLSRGQRKQLPRAKDGGQKCGLSSGRSIMSNCPSKVGVVDLLDCRCENGAREQDPITCE